MNLNDDLNEKIRRLEHRLSVIDVSKEKDFNLNPFNGDGGVFLDLVHENHQNEIHEEGVQEKENPDNYTINVKVNLKKNKVGNNYGMNRQHTEKRKKTLLEISELMHHKPLSKV